MNSIAIKITNLNKKYKMYNRKKDRLLELLFPSKSRHTDFSAIKDLNLEVKKGEVLGILGKNGAGKSTLLKMITGVVTPTSGNIEIDGKISSLLELGTAFNMDLTGYENIYQHGQIMGLSNEEIKAKEKDIIEFADIGDHLSQPVKTYSSGMFARLAFACAINVDPDILIVDEVLSVGDLAFQLKCFKKFEAFKKKGKTIIFVSHNINDILANCSRAIIMEEGQIVFDGTTKEAVDLYKKKTSVIDKKEDKSNTKKDKKNKKEKNKPSKDKMMDKLELNKNMDRYGNKDIEIVDYGIYNSDEELSSIIENSDRVKIVVELKSHIDVKEVMVSFAIKDFNGIEYCGHSEYIKDLHKGDNIEVVYNQTIPLKPERYTLSLGCVHFNSNGEIEIYDRLYDCMIMQITSKEGVLGLFNLDTNTDISINDRK